VFAAWLHAATSWRAARRSALGLATGGTEALIIGVFFEWRHVSQGLGRDRLVLARNTAREALHVRGSSLVEFHNRRRFDRMLVAQCLDGWRQVTRSTRAKLQTAMALSWGCESMLMAAVVPRWKQVCVATRHAAAETACNKLQAALWQRGLRAAATLVQGQGKECQLLIDAAERRVSQGSEGRIVHAYQYAPDALQSIWESFRTRVWSGRGDTSASAGVEPLERLPVCYLNSEARKLSDTILRDRLLPFLERELPDFCRGRFGKCEGLRDMTFSYSNNEPAVNRYVKGGEFPAHKDGYDVTVNVVLSEPEAFTGGGTAFWSQTFFGRLDRFFGTEILLKPPPGMGVVFNGGLSHAGRATESGLRHIYVASFSLTPAGVSKQRE
ncbi:unnamed protein product, partial [Polarella glacialis]